MTDTEILQVLSNMIEPIKTDIQEIKGQLGVTDHKLQTLEESMDHKLQTLEETMDHRLSKIETIVKEDMLPRLSRIETSMEEDICPRLRRIELTQENDILPRLQTIESCYISTYDRYRDSVEDYDKMKQGISILNEVVTEHSKISQKIS